MGSGSVSPFASAGADGRWVEFTRRLWIATSMRNLAAVAMNIAFHFEIQSVARPATASAAMKDIGSHNCGQQSSYQRRSRGCSSRVVLHAFGKHWEAPLPI